MTDLRKAAEMALEALESLKRNPNIEIWSTEADKTMETLRQALVQQGKECIYPECETGIGCDGPCLDNSEKFTSEVSYCNKFKHEPVAYLDEGLGAFYWANDYKKNVGFTPLYAVPPHRWSNTTDEALMQEVRRRGFVIRDAQVGREWVGLTDAERKSCWHDSLGFYRTIETASKEMERILKEKNDY